MKKISHIQKHQNYCCPMPFASKAICIAISLFAGVSLRAQGTATISTKYLETIEAESKSLEQKLEKIKEVIGEPAKAGSKDAEKAEEAGLLSCPKHI